MFTNLSSISPELRDQILSYADKYIYTVMFDDEYSQEKLEEKIKEYQDKADLRSEFSDVDFVTNIEHLVRGYSCFGKDFITAVLSKDLDSTVNMVESCLQQMIEQSALLNDFLSALESKLPEDLKKEIGLSEETE